jgi:hypothetical protein
MIDWKSALLGVAAVGALSACGTSEALWPSPEAAAPVASGTAAVPGGQPAVGGSPRLVGQTTFEPPGVTPGQPTGTAVGDKVAQLRGDLGQLQGSIVDHNRSLQELRARVIEDSQRYHATVAEISARLQVGTTPGNPILVQQFTNAEADLDRLAANVGAMNELATGVNGDSTNAAYLSEATRATFQISGAVDEDHRQLALLQDEVDRTAVLVDRLLSELSDDIRRQSEYISTERGNLNLLASGIRTGEFYGASLYSQSVAATRGGGVAAARRTDVAGKTPLVVIRFDRDTVPYQQALYSAVSQVLERKPSAAFDLVAVTPAHGGAGRVALNTTKARRQAEGVRRSLVDMGLPPVRIAMGELTSQATYTNEVRLFVR